MDEPLPRNIVIDSEAFRFAIHRFWEDLWPGDEMLALADWMDTHRPSGGRHMPNLEDLATRNRMTAKMTRTPWWRRRDAIRKHPPEEQVVVFDKTVWIERSSRGIAHVRVSSRAFADWLRQDAEPADRIPWEDHALVFSLSDTEKYFEWIERGGCTDVGRYLALWAVYVDCS